MFDVLWDAEFALSFAGAVFSFRRRLYLLGIVLVLRVLADGIEHFLHGNAYGRAWWSAEALSCLLLCALACQVAARMFAERGPIFPHICFLLSVAGVLGAWVVAKADTLTQKFLNAEIAVNMLVALLLLLAYGTRRKFLDRTWVGIALGIVAYMVGTAACAITWQFWKDAADLYVFPALAALICWNWAVTQESVEVRSFAVASHRNTDNA